MSPDKVMLKLRSGKYVEVIKVRTERKHILVIETCAMDFKQEGVGRR